MASPPKGPLRRLASLSGLTSRVTSSYVGQRLVGAFQDAELRQQALDRLHVRNEIYRRVFDQRWIKATMPPLASRGLAITLSLAAVLVVALAVRAYFYQPSATQIVVSAYVEQFRKSINSDVRMSVLASLLKLQRSIQATATAGGASVASSDDELAGQAARELFLGLPPADQRALFLDSLQSSPADIQLVVEGLYPALNWVADDQDDPRIMQAMNAALKRGRADDWPLAAEIENWMAGR